MKELIFAFIGTTILYLLLLDVFIYIFIKKYFNQFKTISFIAIGLLVFYAIVLMIL
jgi:hypothetical protein